MKLNSKEEFDESIEITKKAFMASGFEIGEPKYMFTQWLFYFNLIWLYTDVFGEFSWLVEAVNMGKSLDEISMVAPCLTICLLSTSKILPLFLNKQTFQKAVQKLRNIHPDKEESENIERKIVIDSQKYLKSVVKILFFSSLAVNIMFSCEPFMLMGYEYYSTGGMELKLPFLIKYFFDAYANTTIWSLVYVHQIGSIAIVSMNLIAGDTLFYTFCTYLRMHFQILGHRLENLVSPTREDTRNNMRECVKRHQELIELVNLLEILYSKSTLFNISSSSLLLCLCGFNIAVVQKTSVILTFAPFLVMSLAQVYLICFFGDLLMTSSIEIRDAVYSCCWYDADPAIRSSVLVILIRSHKPCKVTAANFADLNLTAFTTILSRSWSCFALLKTMYN